MEDFSIALTSTETSSRQKINKETQALNDTLEQINLIDIYRAFHPKTEEFIFFSSAYGTFSRIDHMLDNKGNLGKFKKTEVIPSIFPDHNTMRLGINYRGKKKTAKNTNIWRLKSMPLNNQGSLKKSKRKWRIKNVETDGYENKAIHNLWDTTKAVLRGKFIAIQSYLRKQEKSQINNLTLHLEQTERISSKTQG